LAGNSNFNFLIMAEQSRRKFLQILGLSAGASIASTSVLGNIIDREEIHRLKPEQQEFMLKYGQWMDEFIEVIRFQKQHPENIDNHKKMMALTETAEKWQPQLTENMKEESFFLIYNASIEKMKREI